MKKIALSLSLAMCCIALCGCWDYRTVDMLTIVAGIAIDVDEEDPEKFAVAFEIVDLGNSTNEGVQSSLLETTGYTITEAIKNAGRKLFNNMFFGNTEILIVSERIVREKGMQVVVDPLLRDNSIRDNLTVLVSVEKTAKEIITPTEEPRIVSFEVNESIGSTQKNEFNANATRTLELDQIYNDLITDRYQLALPAIRFSDPESKQLETDGLCLFQDDKAVGYLENTDLPWFIMAGSNLKNGSINVYLQSENSESPLYFSTSIQKSKPKTDFEFDGETFTFTIHIKAKVEMAEQSRNMGEITDPLLRQMEERTESTINQNVERVIEKIRDEYGTDCLGFGASVSDRNPVLWNEVRENWREWFQSCEIKVEADVFINDTGLMKNF